MGHEKSGSSQPLYFSYIIEVVWVVECRLLDETNSIMFATGLIIKVRLVIGSQTRNSESHHPDSQFNSHMIHVEYGVSICTCERECKRDNE